ncbi:MAG: hypothetical protein ACOC6H_02600 [Thermoproteota archaeon]
MLSKYGWPINIQTKSPLVLRDPDLFQKFQDLQVVITLATGAESIREKFEMNVPTVEAKIQALEKLRSRGSRPVP